MTDHGGKRKGAGRKPTFTEAARSVNFCLPERLIDKLARLARKNDTNINRYLAKVVEDAK